MKKTTLITVMLSFALFFTSYSQNRSINFDENQDWKSVVKKALAADKYIFMDCYTTWCGPCKLLDKNVFSNDEIADYYNANFINAKYDMEKGEGITLKDKYNVTAFPTLLFIDPKTEEVIHRVVGAGDVPHMMEQAKIANDRENNLQGIKSLYEADKSNVEALDNYLKMLSKAGMGREQNSVAVEYLSTLSNEQLMQEQNWKILETNVTDPLSEPLQRVFANKQVFARTLGADKVNNKLKTSLQIATLQFNNRTPDPLPDFDQERYDRLLDFVLKSTEDSAPFCAVQLYATGYAQKQDYANLLKTIEDALKYNMLQGQLRQVFILSHLSKFTNVNDTSLQQDASNFIDNLIATTTDPYSQSSYYRMKSLLLEKYGDSAGSKTAAESAEKIAKEAQKNGVTPMRMM